MIFENYLELCLRVTQEILVTSNRKIASQNRFSLVLSGGSTPRGVYACMAQAPYRTQFQWKKIHLFFGDERWVPSDDPQSNFRMVKEVLLSKIKIPPLNVHPITFQGDIKDSARLYEEDIRGFFNLRKGACPRFDLVLLGLGQDGHTASLFPGNSALSVHDRLVVTTAQKGIPTPRISLTLPVLNHAEAVFFLVSGAEKAQMVHQVLVEKNKDLPAGKINPGQAKLHWFLDKDAAYLSKTLKCIGVAADHGGWRLKGFLTRKLRKAGYRVIDFGNLQLNPSDDYPDFVVPLAQAVARGQVDRGIAICGSGVGACIAANKIAGVRGCMIHEPFSAKQGVEDDDMNVICLGSKVLKATRAWDLVKIFLAARFSHAERHSRRLDKISALEIHR